MQITFKDIASLWGGKGAELKEKVCRFSLLLFILVLPFTHNAALKYVAMLGMLIGLLPSIFKKEVRPNWESPIIQTLVVLFLLVFLSSLLGKDALGNMDAMRKHFTPIILVFLVMVKYFRSSKLVLALMLVLTAGFGLRAALAFFDMLTTTREEGLFFKGYAMEASLYMPIVLGLAMVIRGNARYVVFAIALLGWTAVIANESRTAIVAISLAGMLIPVALKQWRWVTLFVVVAASAVAMGVALKPNLSDRYASSFDQSSYAGPNGMSGRYPIWIGAWQLIKQHPVLGYGFGWKKLGKTAQETGLVDQWNVSSDPYLQAAAKYFSLPTEKVNPHNLVIQILFEVGFLGLLAYIAMLLALLWQGIQLIRSTDPAWRGLGALSLGFLASYLVMNVSNGLWIGVGPSAIIVAMLEISRRNHGTSS